MTPERWRQIEALYHSVREGGVALLDGTDPEIRREVERLLACDSGDRIIDREAADVLAEMTRTQALTEAQTAFSGQTISHYQILEKLGAGGMGVVYKALDTRLNRYVALKFLPPHLSHDEDLKARLSEEARAASALDHPNIVVIHDIDETPDGGVFIAMAFHQGVTLRHRIAAGVSVKEALEIARQIASGLARAHEHGIFHRDIKPANVIVTENGVARIIDFGLARSIDTTVTAEGFARGTPLYMSPEQATGKAIDLRTDLFSLGAVLYEMLAARPPFRGESQLQLMRAVATDEPLALREARPEIAVDVETAGIQAIVTRALQKDPAKRYQSAADMVNDLSAGLALLEAPKGRSRLRAVFVIPAAALLLLIAGASIWLYLRSEKRNWAHAAIPEITRLKTQNKPVAAFRLMQEVQKYLPGDSQLAQISEGLTHSVSVHSTPPGASVEIKDYLSPKDAWLAIGTTPLENVKIPSGYLRWRLSKAGVGEYVGAPIVDDIHGFIREFKFQLDGIARAPAGMISVSARTYTDYIWSLGFLGPYELPAFYIDRFEVTNRQYQEFVNKSGYRKREYWKENFVRDGKDLSWEQAMDVFVDSTGRHGPSTWTAGRFPPGQEDYPVGGVSWYEASAYAEFAGKKLPVIAQWYLAAPSSVARFITPQSNFSDSTAPVGKYSGLGALGTYDMAGNVAEWCANDSGGGARYILGGGARTASTEYLEPGTLPPFHRAANAGFRCVRNTAELPVEARAQRKLITRTFANAKPAPDAVFQVYKAMYSYDRTPLNAKQESVAQDSPDWRKEKITFDAAYGKERMAAYLFVPVHVNPPYQTVIFSPSGRVLDIPSSENLGEMNFIDYVIQSGRAVLYPVYKGTYERAAEAPGLDTVAGRDTVIQQSKDIGRSIDYLETRPDIDPKRIAYMGVSMGAAHGVIFAAVEHRFSAVILLDGGFYAEVPVAGADQADFAPRMKAPTLLVSGKFDWIFLDKEAFIRLIGAPAADKKAVLLDTAHDVSEQRTDLIREVVAWLDRYFGRVN